MDNLINYCITNNTSFDYSKLFKPDHGRKKDKSIPKRLNNAPYHVVMDNKRRGRRL